MKKNVVFILTNYIGGGQEQCFNKTAKVLLQSKADISVYLYVVNRFTKKEQLPRDVTIIETFKGLIMLKLCQQKCVFINYSSDWKSSLITALISRKYISWVHGNPLVMATAQTQKINFYFLKRSYQIVCVCHEQEELLQDIYQFDKSRLLTIYNCVDLDNIREKRKEFLAVKYKYILMVARFDFDSKDYPTLLRAYAHLEENLRNEYKLVLLGDGPDEDEVRSMVEKLNLTEYVIMPGYDTNPFKWMANASLVLLISKTEGLGLVVLEAMACRTPVLITNYHTGAREIAQNNENCLMVEIGDVGGLTKMISEMLADTELTSKLTENAIAFVQKFDYRYFAKHINDFFNSLWKEGCC